MLLRRRGHRETLLKEPCMQYQHVLKATQYLSPDRVLEIHTLGDHILSDITEVSFFDALPGSQSPATAMCMSKTGMHYVDILSIDSITIRAPKPLKV